MQLSEAVMKKQLKMYIFRFALVIVKLVHSCNGFRRVPKSTDISKLDDEKYWISILMCLEYHISPPKTFLNLKLSKTI